MEKILSKKLALVLAVLLASLGLSSAAQTMQPAMQSFENMFPQCQSKSQKVDGVRTKTFINHNQVNKVQTQRTPVKSEEQNVTINIAFDRQDNVQMYPEEIMAISDSQTYSIYEEGPFELPAGTYMFITTDAFTIIDSENYIQYAYVVKESVTVHDGMTITFDADEAKNYVQLEAYDIQGNIIQPPKSKVQEDGSIGYDPSEGNDYLNLDLMFYHKNYGKIYKLYGKVPFHGTHFYISDISDNVVLNSVFMFDKDNQIHYFAHCLSDIHDDIVCANDPNDYIVHEEIFKPSPMSNTNPFVGVSITDGGMAHIEVFYNHAIDDGKVQMCVGKYETISERPNILFVGECDYVLYDEDNDPYEFIYSQPIINDNGKLKYIYNGKNSFSNPTKYVIDDELVIPYIEWPGNPLFSDEVSSYVGNNCPITVSEVGIDKFDVVSIHQFLNFSLGRYGELRESDYHGTYATINNKGEVSDANVGRDGTFSLFDASGIDGVIDIMITNENVNVDGIDGKNVTELNYNTSRDDMRPPTLTALRFVTSERQLTDRFATPADGCVELYAGDFNTLRDENYDFYCLPGQVTAEVAYSPFGEDAWNELPLEEDSELYDMPGLGQFYKGSLAAVSGQAYEGWFDLKVKVTDAAGNWQEQVISPAFRIDDLAYSSIANVEPNSNNSDNAIYNLAGQRMRGDLDALPRGVYIVGGKKVVK